MDSAEFRKRAKQMVDYICKYNETVETRKVTPSMNPGFLRSLISSEIPETPDKFDDIMKDFDSKIMPGMTHWTHPQFHAYFPAGTSYPCILSDMLTTCTNVLAFSWVASPACTELETKMVDWMGKALGLPDKLLASTRNNKAGGVIQSGASECVLVAMLGARARALERLKIQYPSVDEGMHLSNLIAYCSEQAHSCVEKAAKIAFVKIRIIETDEDGRLDPKKLIKLMEDDEHAGLEPFFVSTTFGTAASTAIDRIDDIGTALQGYPHVWLHVDGAYAGCALICPELRPLLKGLEYADSFNVNPHKWLLTSFECSILYVRDTDSLAAALVVEPLYLKHEYSKEIEYRHWSISLTRRFRALKLWFVLRCYGIAGLQNHIRNHIKLAKYFEQLMRRDARFEICNEVNFGLVCFRLDGSDLLNETFLRDINATGLIHMIPAIVNGKYFIRFSVNAAKMTTADIDKSCAIIKNYTEKVWKKSEALQNFLSKMNIDGMEEMCPYFAKVASTYMKSDYAITDPMQRDSAKAKSGPQDRRKSWISLPLGLPDDETSDG